MIIRSISLVLVLSASMTSGCGSIPAATMPIATIEVAEARSRNESVVIMLPVSGDRASAFIREGFEQEAKRHGIDSIAVDAHIGYYMQRKLITRLHEDVVSPARRAGYKHVWLLGISMGGLGSLLYVANHPDEVDGVILLAPFLGNADASEEIAAKGGFAAWDRANSELEGYELAVWSTLDRMITQDDAIPLILGYGNSDRNANGYGVLLDALEPSRVWETDGGHSWTAWRRLWAAIAANLYLAGAR